MTIPITFTAGTKAKASETNTNFSWCDNLCPIGGIIAWAKTMTGVPSLSTNFHECDGSTISDAGSPMNGQVLPNLNTGTYRMLRGAATSGGTGGSDTETHTHDVTITSFPGSPNNGTPNAGANGNMTKTTSAPSDTNNLPAYYGVVWVMRIK